MDLTRREFFGYTAGAIGLAGLPLPQSTPTEVDPRARLKVDRWRAFPTNGAGNDCESTRGYRSAIPKARSQYSSAEHDPYFYCSLIVLPHVLELDSLFAGCIVRNALRRGNTVVIESGAGFGGHLDFGEHRRSMREGLQIALAAPVDLWSDRSGGRVPFVEFTWPRRAAIRDFSRVVPPADPIDGEVIAWAGDLAVAFRRRVGNGTLIYLGSPVGPALWAGDAEARRWLYAVALAA